MMRRKQLCKDVEEKYGRFLGTREIKCKSPGQKCVQSLRDRKKAT